MMRSLLAFEGRYQGSRLFLPLAALLFFGFGWLTGGGGFSPGNTTINAPYQIAYLTGLFSLGAVFVSMFAADSGVLRDRHYQTEALIFSSGLAKRPYFWSRFLGVFGGSLIAFSAFILGLSLSPITADVPGDWIGPYRPLAYFLSWLIMAVPSVMVASVWVFGVALLTRNRVATYGAAVFLYALYFVCSAFFESPLMAGGNPEAAKHISRLAALADPYGLTPLFQMTAYWTPQEKNDFLIQLSGPLLANRIWWLLSCGAVLGITYGLFRFRTVVSSKRLSKRTVPDRSPPDSNSSAKLDSFPEKPPPFTVAPTSTKKRIAYPLAAVSAETSLLLRQLFSNLAFRATLLIWFIILGTEYYASVMGGGDYGERHYPTFRLILEAIGQPLTLLGAFSLVFFAGELSSLARDRKVAPLVHAGPVGNGVLLLARLFALWSIPVTLLGIALLMGLGLQWWMDFPFTRPLRWITAFYWRGADLLLFGVLTLTVSTLIRQKYLAMLISMALLLGLSSSMAVRIGLEYPLLRFGHLPELPFSDAIGYGGSKRAFHLLFVHWAACCLTLLGIAYRFWPRRLDVSRSKQTTTVPSLLPNRTRALLLLFIPPLLTGSFVWRELHVKGDYVSRTEQLDRRAAYETQYGHYDGLPDIKPVAVDLSADLYPSEGRFEVEGTLQLTNPRTRPIDTLFLTAREPLEVYQLEGGELLEKNETLDAYLFVFRPALLPGDTIDFHFRSTYRDRGFRADRRIAAGGSYLPLNGIIPAFEYLSGREITDPRERESRGLAPRPVPVTVDAHLESAASGVGKIPFDLRLSTEADHTLIATGQRISDVLEGGRRRVHFRSVGGMMPLLTVFSAPYENRSGRWRDVQLEQYYFPGHDYNVETAETYVKKTLSFCDTAFGAYPYDHLRVAEIPAYYGRTGGQALAGTIAMVENNFHLLDGRNTSAFDLVAKRTIHEVAHQWWGHLVSPVNAPGSGLLVEGLAKYTEAAVMEQTHGPAALYALAQNARRRYLRGRGNARGPEPPPLYEDGRQYVLYGKALTLMLGLRELVGTDRFHEALRRLTAHNRGKAERSTNALDFLTALQDVAPEHDDLIDQWLRQNITYEFSVAGAEVSSLPDGKYRVTARVNARRYEVLDDGSKREMDFGEPVPFGFFRTRPGQAEKRDVIHRSSASLVGGDNELEWIVPDFPAFLIVDPFGTRVEEDVEDNVFRF